MKKNKRKARTIPIFFLGLIAGIVVTVVALALVILDSAGVVLQPSNYYIIASVLSLSSFLATSFFSILIYNHNVSIKEQNNEIRSQTDAVNRRAEAFRNLQFIASNYTIIDFVDYMLLYAEYQNYLEKLRELQDFSFYLLEEGIDKTDVLNNFNDFDFLTLRIPIKIVEGKTIGKITFTRIKFQKANSTHRFFPPKDCSHSGALILYNENDSRSEAIINLIVHKDSEFYTPKEVIEFLKIKAHINMESLLGVVVSGSIELYFTNPEKIDKSGINKYKINSSQFELKGKPRLNSKEFDPD